VGGDIVYRARNRQNYKQTILSALQASDFGHTPAQVAQNLKIARATATKYLEELRVEGKVEVHSVGPYAVYSLKRHGNFSVYQTLYYAATMYAGLLESGHSPLSVESIWYDLADKVTLPYEEDILPVKGQPTPDYLDRIIHVTVNILSELGYFLEYPKTEIVPPLGTQSPMTRLIRVIDEGFFDHNAGIHYNLIAGLLQEKLSSRAGIPVIFRLTPEIQPEEHVLYYEIGFIESYYLDASVIEQVDTLADPREYLDAYKNYLGRHTQLNVREYDFGGSPHYEFKFVKNREWEEFFALRAMFSRKSAELFRKLHLQSNRKWVPYVDWTESPFLVIQLVSNVGFAFDDYTRAMMEVYPLIGYCIYVEKIPNGLRMNFKEERDYKAYFTEYDSEDDIRALYASFGIESEEFLEGRKQILQEILEEMKQIRQKYRARKYRSKVIK
jgi:predicted ArsR family transcriptional regulator